MSDLTVTRTKKIRVDFAWISVDHDVWNFEVMKVLAEMLMKRLFPDEGAKILQVNFMRCWVDYEVPADFRTEMVNEYNFHIRAEDIKD